MTHTNLELGNFGNMTQQKNYLYTKKKKIALMINCYNKAAKKDRRGGGIRDGLLRKMDVTI